MDEGRREQCLGFYLSDWELRTERREKMGTIVLLRDTNNKICVVETTKLTSEIKEDLNERRDVLRSWVGRLNVVKMSLLTKLMYRFSDTTVTTGAVFFVEIYRLFLKLI